MRRDCVERSSYLSGVQSHRLMAGSADGYAELMIHFLDTELSVCTATLKPRARLRVQTCQFGEQVHGAHLCI